MISQHKETSRRFKHSLWAGGQRYLMRFASRTDITPVDKQDPRYPAYAARPDCWLTLTDATNAHGAQLTEYLAQHGLTVSQKVPRTAKGRRAVSTGPHEERQAPAAGAPPPTPSQDAVPEVAEAVAVQAHAKEAVQQDAEMGDGTPGPHQEGGGTPQPDSVPPLPPPDPSFNIGSAGAPPPPRGRQQHRVGTPAQKSRGGAE